MRELTTRAGVELIQDFIGAAYWQRNLHCLKVGGRLVLVGLMGGTKVEADLGLILRQRLHIIGLVMRSQSLESKIAMTQRFRERWLPLLAQGHIRLSIPLFPGRSGCRSSVYGRQPQRRQDYAHRRVRRRLPRQTGGGTAYHNWLRQFGEVHLAQPGKQVILRTIDGDA